MPRPSTTPPSTGRRSASARPHRPAATPAVRPSSGDSACARSQKPIEPTRIRTGSQRNARPVELAARERGAREDREEQEARGEPRGVVRRERRRERAHRRGRERGHERAALEPGLAGEARHRDVAGRRHLPRDAERRRVLGLPRVVADQRRARSTRGTAGSAPACFSARCGPDGDTDSGSTGSGVAERGGARASGRDLYERKRQPKLPLFGTGALPSHDHERAEAADLPAGFAGAGFAAGAGARRAGLAA